MAVAVTLACAAIAFPIAYYMARYARGRTKALLYVAVMLPLWSSYLVRLYAWKLLLAKEGAISWAAQSAAPAGAARRAAVGCRWSAGRSLSLLAAGHLHRLRLHVAAVHDPADPGGDRAHPALADRGLGRPRRLAARRPSAR